MFYRNGFPGKLGKNEPNLLSGILLKCILNMSFKYGFPYQLSRKNETGIISSEFS